MATARHARPTVRRRVALAVVPITAASGLALLASRAEGLPSGGSPPTATATTVATTGPPASCSPTDLGTLGGGQGIAVAVSSNGLVTGWAQDGSGTPQPVLWRSGKATRIATGLINVSPTAVNSRGEVVGTGVDAADQEEVGWAWIDGRTTRLQAPRGKVAVPAAINDSGRIVGALAANDDGAAEPTSGEAPEQAATWASSSAAAKVLPALPGDAGAHVYGLNKNGLMVGNSQGADRFTPTVWDAAGHVTALPGLSGRWGIARAVDDNGVIAGSVAPATGDQQAMVWDVGRHGHARGGAGRAVQANGLTGGLAVGQTDGHGRTQAVRWDASGKAAVLPALPGRPGAGVNAASTAGIVGFSSDGRGAPRPTFWRCGP
jgi:uncharacterized membrane protein